MDNLKTWPERIYLQCGDDASEPGDTPDYADCHDITWEAEKINACDVAYVRADLASAHDTIASELDKVTVDKCAHLAKKGMRFVGAVMTDADGRRATIDMGRVTWSDAPIDGSHLSHNAGPAPATKKSLRGQSDFEDNPYVRRYCDLSKHDNGEYKAKFTTTFWYGWDAAMEFYFPTQHNSDPLQELADQAQALGMGYGKPEFDNWFDEYWETHGQFVRAGGGDYEKSFAYRAAEAMFSVKMRFNPLQTKPQIIPEIIPESAEWREFLISTKKVLESQRTWAGQGWHYNAMHPNFYRPILNRIEAMLLKCDKP